MPRAQVLAHWRQQGHKALLFTQTQQMLDIVERAIQGAEYRHAALLSAQLSVAPHHQQAPTGLLTSGLSACLLQYSGAQYFL